MNLTVNSVTITLTPEQLEEINKQTNKFKSSADINSYEDACKILNIKPRKLSHYYCPTDEISTQLCTKEFAFHQIQIIGQAANLVDSGKRFVNWENKQSKKFYPWFTKESGGLVFRYSCYDCGSFSGEVFFYNNEITATNIGKKFVKLYEQLL